MNSKSLLTGLLVGSTLSAIITLLTTPKSGKEIQRTCKENATKVQKGIQLFVEDSKEFTNQLKHTSSISKQAVAHVGSEIKDSVTDWKTDITPTLNLLKEDIEALQKKIQQVKKPPVD